MTDEKKRRSAGRSRRSARDRGVRPARRHIATGEFKATCLELMERVRETGEEIVITKRNRPIAKLAPLTGDDVEAFVGRSRGVIVADPEALLSPVAEDWEVDADL